MSEPDYLYWLYLAPGTEALSVEDAAGLAVQSMHPDGAYHTDEMAQEEVRQEYLTLLDELRPLVQDSASQDEFLKASISLVELKRKLFDPHRIDLRERLHFVTSARPLEVPAALLALPDDARVSYEHNIARQRGSGIVNAADYRDSIRATMARQAEGYFTLNEAAQVLADSRPGMRAVAWVAEIQQAHRAGVLPIRDRGSRLRMRPLLANRSTDIPKEWTAVQDRERDDSDLLLVAELDAWLRDSVGYGFPRVDGASLPGPFATPAAEKPQRKTWRDVAWAYVVGRLQSGQFSSAVELNHMLHAEAEREGSPFDKGEGQHRGSLWVREIAQPLKLKTIQNVWQELRTAAGLK